MARVIIIGPAHPLREGGIVSFNHRLALAFQEAGHDCEMVAVVLGCKRLDEDGGVSHVVVGNHDVLVSTLCMDWEATRVIQRK